MLSVIMLKFIVLNVVALLNFISVLKHILVH
jgi:hypothetical protein